jgi:hypothetical protein
VAGDDPSALGGALAFGTTAGTASPVGLYPISVSGLTSTNYAITFVGGTLKILYASPLVCGHRILPPIDAGGASVFKAGRTVPAKFTVCDVNGASIGTPGVVTSFSFVDPTAPLPDATFRWDPVSQQWVLNIDTKAAFYQAGSAYHFHIGLNDGTGIEFGLRQ